MPHPFLAVPTPIVIGHRGAAGESPENTLASFRWALDAGAAILETDVHLTRDSEPVLIHDSEVSRVTESSGRVRDLDLESLQHLDAGYRFSPDGGDSHPERGAGHRVPTLREALEAFPDARFNLDLKEDVPGIVERTLEVVRSVRGTAGAARVLLVSADAELMERLRERAAATLPTAALGASGADVGRFARAAVADVSPELLPAALQIPPVFAGQPLITPELVRFAHRHDVHVHAWTINDADALNRMLDLGVDGIVSDFPARVAALIRARTPQ